MAPRNILMNHFFDQLLTFMKELSEMYPSDPDFPLGITSVQMIKTMNPSMGPSLFYDSAKAFESEILSKNEKFFLDHSFGEFGNDVDFNLLAKLKQYVATMSPTSKVNVWTYVQNLYKLSKAIIGPST
jgi:hypothetical protein